MHAKPYGVDNFRGGYFDPLLVLLDRAVSEGFLKREHGEMLLVEASPVRLLDAFDAYKPPAVEKWIDRDRREPTTPILPISCPTSAGVRSRLPVAYRLPQNMST